MLSLLIALLAQANPRVVIDAEVGDGWIRGVLTVADGDVGLIDPLRDLPAPVDDVTQGRTFRGRPEQGEVRFRDRPDGSVWFHTLLPARYGDLGALDGRIVANGGWYPQPLEDGRLPNVDWDVTLHLPDGVLGVLGDHVGVHTLRWEGTAERVSMAAMREGWATPISGEGHALVLVTPHRPRPGLVAALHETLPFSAPSGHTWRGVIVEAPMRRRLVRPGVGTTFLSDRAWRAFGLARRLHHTSVMRELTASWVARPDPYERSLTAAALGLRFQQQIERKGAWRKLLSFLYPPADPRANDRTVPFTRELYGFVHVIDPLQDDLAERFAPFTTGPVVVAQLADAWGPEAPIRLGLALLDGASMEDAAAVGLIEPAELEAWRHPYPLQDYILRLDRTHDATLLQRIAPPDAPPEVVTIRMEDELRVLRVGPGPQSLVVDTPPGVERVVLDPYRHLDQLSRFGDARPWKLRFGVSGAVTTLNLSDFYFEGWAGFEVRRDNDSHNRWNGRLFHDAESWVGAEIGYVRFEGRSITASSRAHRIGIAIDPTVLDPNFAPLQGSRFAMGTTASYRWDTRNSYLWPLRGSRVAVQATLGFVFDNPVYWLSVRGSAMRLQDLHPRHVIASRAVWGFAVTDLDHRKLPLGGSQALRSLPVDAVLGNVLMGGMMEYRFAPLRQASWWLGPGWLSEIQLAVGVEGGTSLVERDWVGAVGVTAGASVTVDVFGIQPSLMGLTAAWPVWSHGIALERDPWVPQITARATQEF